MVGVEKGNILMLSGGLWVKDTFTIGFFVWKGYKTGHNGCCCYTMVSDHLLERCKKPAAWIVCNLPALTVCILNRPFITGAAYFTVIQFRTFTLGNWQASIGIGMPSHVPHTEWVSVQFIQGTSHKLKTATKHVMQCIKIHIPHMKNETLLLTLKNINSLKNIISNR